MKHHPEQTMLHVMRIRASNSHSGSVTESVDQGRSDQAGFHGDVCI
jgi:hypothetical protein